MKRRISELGLAAVLTLGGVGAIGVAPAHAATGPSAHSSSSSAQVQNERHRDHHCCGLLCFLLCCDN